MANGNTGNKNNGVPSMRPSVALYYTFSPLSLMGLGILLVVLSVWVGRLGTKDFGKLWPELLVASYLLIIGFMAMLRWTKSDTEGFLVGKLSPNPRVIVKYAPIIAGFVMWMIATAVARAEDKIRWGDVVPELLGAITLFAIGGFMVLKG